MTSNIIRQIKEDKFTTLKVIAARLDALNAPTVEKEVLDYVVTQETPNIIFDLSELEYVSSAGLRACIALAKAVRPKGGKLVILVTNEDVKNIFDVSGFSSLLDIQNTTAAAEKAFK